MRILTFNLRGTTGIGVRRRPKLIDAIASHAPEIIGLQELPWRNDTHLNVIERLADAGWPHAAYSGVPGSPDKRYGNVVASRWPVETGGAWHPAPPWPQSLLDARVTAPGGNVRIVVAHIPNGAGNGWRKVETLEALAAGLHDHEPTVVCGDFNEPRAFVGDAVRSFGERRRADGTWTRDGLKRGTCGQRFARRCWSEAVDALLGATAVHGLQPVWRRLGHADAPVTHRVRGHERRFDHILVTPDIEVTASACDETVLDNRISDHAIVWADVNVCGA